MSCNSCNSSCSTCNRKNTCNKSVQTAYNSVAQTITSNANIVVLGNLATDSGCSIHTQNDGFVIRNSGIYRISYDVTFTNTSAGTAILMLYKDAVALPCANAEGTVAEGSITTLHAETTICTPTCCNFNPLISARMTAPAGTIINVCANVTRIS